MPRKSTNVLSTKQVEANFHWHTRFPLRHYSVMNHLGSAAHELYLELVELLDPAGKPIRCVLTANGDVLYDPQGYAEYVRRQFM